MDIPVEEIIEKNSLPMLSDALVVKSSYSQSHRNYYLAHKKEIYQKDYEKGKYKRRYERKKEELQAKALARYYRRKEAKMMEALNQNLTDAPLAFPANQILSLTA